MEDKTILVFGATGRQGSSVVRHLLRDGSFKVKGFARKREEKTLDEKIDLIRGDLHDKKAVSDAMKDCYGIYVVTDFWDDPKNPQKEVEQGKNIMQSAKDCGVQHVVFSSLENTKEMTNGENPVECCDSKAEILDFAKSLSLPLTEIRIAFYMENFIRRTRPKKKEDGTVLFDLPMADKKLDLICAEDIGMIVKEVFKNKREYLGKVLKIASDSLNGNEIANIYSRVTKDRAVYEAKPLDSMKDEENGQVRMKLFKFYQDFEGKLRDVEETKRICPDVLTFEKWLKKTNFTV